MKSSLFPSSSSSRAAGLVGLAAALATALALLPDLDRASVTDLDGLDGVYAETATGSGYFLLEPASITPRQVAALDRIGVESDADTGLLVLGTDHEMFDTPLHRLEALALEDPDGPDARDLGELRRLVRLLDEASSEVAGLAARGFLTA